MEYQKICCRRWKKLDGIKNPKAVAKSAVNYTTASQKELARRIQTVYRYQGGASAVMDASSLDKATAGSPISTIHFKSPTFEISRFHASSNLGDRGKVYGAVKKKTSPTVLKKETGLAFVVRFDNGHMAVVYRGTEKEVSPSRAKKDRYRGHPRDPYRYNQHTATLKLVSSPAIPSMVKSEEVYGHLEGKYEYSGRTGKKSNGESNLWIIQGE